MVNINSAKKVRIMCEAIMIFGIVLGALSLNGYFEPQYTCSFGESLPTQVSRYGSLFMIIIGVYGVLSVKRSLADRGQEIGSSNLG